MRSALFLLIFFTSFGLSAQEVIATQGESFSNASITLDWTIGETVIGTISDTSYQLTQGFHQPQLVITSVEKPLETLDLKIFPNPTADLIQIDLVNIPSNVSYELYDVNGKLLEKNELTVIGNTIQLSGHSAGTYFLVLKNNLDKKLGTYKIQKVQ